MSVEPTRAKVLAFPVAQHSRCDGVSSVGMDVWRSRIVAAARLLQRPFRRAGSPRARPEVLAVLSRGPSSRPPFATTSQADRRAYRVRLNEFVAMDTKLRRVAVPAEVFGAAIPPRRKWRRSCFVVLRPCLACRRQGVARPGRIRRARVESRLRRITISRYRMAWCASAVVWMRGVAQLKCSRLHGASTS